MNACVLCLGCADTSYSLMSAEGLGLKIRDTIAKHFSFFELPSTCSDARVICRECWECLTSFDELYQRVFNLHQHQRLQQRSSTKSATIEFCGEAESEAVNPLFAVELDALAEGFYATSEIKVEVNELEPLPKVELLEDPVDTEAKTTSAKRARSLSEVGPTQAKRRIKDELPLDSDSDVPLAEFLEPAPVRQTRRRGRPPKAKPVPAPASPKKELLSDEDDNEEGLENGEGNDDDDMEFVPQEAVLGTDDSDSSSSDSSGNDSDASLPDIEPEERYAEIPKRVIVKPKKYRKREKPLVPPVRMSRQEIERRKRQQNEYDKIILEFFKKFPCSICNLLVKNFGDMRQHQRMSHNIDSGFIECCGKKFHIRKALAEHVLVHKNPEHFMCSQCGRVCQDSRSLEIHELTHTNPEGKTETKDKPIYQCDKCPKSFTTKAAMEYHNVSKHVPKSEFKYSCPECNKKIPTERKLKEHIRYMHDPETAIICDKCGKTLRSQTNLKKHHELEHSEEPRPKPDPVQCEICGTWLRHLSGLKQHMNTVHEPPGGEHRCHICNKTSTNSRALKRHIYHNHLCERKFKCGMCEKAFKRPQDLREHTSTHTGEVLYTCPNCPMTFFSNANMYKHRQRLHRAEWEADRKKPLPPNIMKISQGATMKKRQASSGLFPQSTEQKQ
ncbi:hypothetical protein KR018_003894 [Drosophila ironensis]|nr:hypothetical protein KR018_003894 [Drosophila ironensis]